MTGLNSHSPAAGHRRSSGISHEPSVAVVGGGITGLTAAYRLKQAGIHVTLFEAGYRVGGVIQSIRHNGFLAEYGPNTILETSPRIGELLRDLRLTGRMIYSAPEAEKRYIARNWRLVEVPSSPAKFFSTDLFSWKAKARLLREPFIRKAPADMEENLEQFVLRRLGREFLDYAINPFVAGVYAGDPARLSVKYAFPKLHALEQTYGSLIRGQILGARERRQRGEVSRQRAKKLSFDEGLQVLIDALERELADTIVLRTPVEMLEQLDDGWRLHVPSETRKFDAVLLAAPAHKLGQIKLDIRSEVSFKPLLKIHYPPVTSVVLGFRREDVSHPLDGFGVLVPEVERMNILGTIFSSSLFPNRAPEGHVTLTVYLGGARNPRISLEDRTTVRRLVLNDLNRLLGVKGKPVFEHHTTFRNAIPQYEIGYGRFKNLMNDVEQSAPGLFFAGHYRDGISLSDSLVSGDNAAPRIIQYLKAVA